VRGIGTGAIVFGIHIAAPGLAISPDSPLDRLARERMSTVYMPGWKLTMLPDDVVAAYTLTEGRECPAVSLYVTVDEASLEIRHRETRLERVPIVANLRHDRLDDVITEDSLTGGSAPAYPFAAELAFAFRLARGLKVQREQVRGKPETFSRPDYNFRLESDGTVPPDGTERVSITARHRGAPLDLIVSEAMILANSTWGAWLADHGVPAIYRSQASLLPGVKVRMGTKPLPHAGMGVAQYSWSTSPLRRYVDLVNQWQIIACARHGRTAPLAAPFRAKDSALFGIVSAFESAYAAYADFQHGIERFWTLMWLRQNDVQALEATTLREGLVRADRLPLVFRVPGSESLPRGSRIRARVKGFDLLTLDLHAQLLEQLGDVVPTRDAEPEDEMEDSGPLTLSIDLDDGAPVEPASPGAPPP